MKSLRHKRFLWLACLATVCQLAPRPGELRAAQPAAPNRAVVTTAAAAKHAYDMGDHARAAELYFQAHQLDPGDGAFLFGSARSLQLAGQLALAATRYAAFLQNERGHADLRARASRHLADTERAREERAAASARAAVRPGPPREAALREIAPPQPATPTDVQAPAASMVFTAVPAPHWPQQVALWGGIGLVAVGTAAFASATVDQYAFAAAMAPGWQGQKVAGYASRAEASQAARAIANGQNLGLGLASVGAVAMAIALWPRAEKQRTAGVVPGAGWVPRLSVRPDALAAEVAW